MSIQLGSNGDSVTTWQEYLGISPADGAFGPYTDTMTKEAQTRLGVTADGIVGPGTVNAAINDTSDAALRSKLETIFVTTAHGAWADPQPTPDPSYPAPTPSPEVEVPGTGTGIKVHDLGPAPTGAAGVALWQRITGIQSDGVYGPQSVTATKIWQSNHELTADGVVGPQSWQAAGYSTGPLLKYVASAPQPAPVTPKPPPSLVTPVKPPVKPSTLLAGMSLGTWGMILGGLGVGYALLTGAGKPPRRG